MAEERGFKQKSRQERIREARESVSRQENFMEHGRYSRGTIPGEDKEEAPAVKKGTLFRLFLASALFLLVFAWDQSGIQVSGYSSQTVKEAIGNNKIISQLVEGTALFLEERVLPVFQGFGKKS